MENFKTIDIDSLICLCDLLHENEDFESFYNELSFINMIKPSFNKKYETILNHIDLYECKKTFLSKNTDVLYFWNYITKNKENLFNIMTNARKIQSLGFNMIFLDESITFEDNNYILTENFYEGNLQFLENMEYIDSNENSIIYKTTFSNYMIDISFNKCVGKVYMDSNYKMIVLNNLIFNSEKLPILLDTENIYSLIKGMQRIR